MYHKNQLDLFVSEAGTGTGVLGTRWFRGFFVLSSDGKRHTWKWHITYLLKHKAGTLPGVLYLMGIIQVNSTHTQVAPHFLKHIKPDLLSIYITPSSYRYPSLVLNMHSTTRTNNYSASHDSSSQTEYSSNWFSSFGSLRFVSVCDRSSWFSFTTCSQCDISVSTSPTQQLFVLHLSCKSYYSHSAYTFSSSSFPWF